MHEPYRTLLGHFRHEIGHYYWDRLVRCRAAGASRARSSATSRIDYNEAPCRPIMPAPPRKTGSER